MKLQVETLRAWVAVGLFAWTGAVVSAPSVGTVTQGTGTITLQGSGFGAHANYGAGKPFLNRGWNNFENGSINGGNFSIEHSPENWRLATGGNRPNSKFHIQKFYSISRLGAYGLTQQSGVHEWYTTFWFKLLPKTQSGKFFRIWGNPQTDNVYLSTGGENTLIRGFSETLKLPAETQWSSPNSFGYDVWHRVEIWMDDSPAEFTVWIDGKWQFTRTDWVPSPFDGAGHTWEVGMMIDDPAESGGLDGAYCFDDVFFNHTRARVEIGNAPTWAATTVREIQIPVSWSSTSITVQTNITAFAPGSTAYLFVVDASGAVSGGVPITVGGSGASIAAPQNLRLVK